MGFEQCHDLWNRYQQGRSHTLRNRIAIHNDSLALKVAARWQKECPESLEDLQQIARMGLLKAVERFDISKKVAFSSFAVPYINGEIQHWLRDKWNLIKVPRQWKELYQQFSREQKAYEQMGLTVTLEAIALAHGLSRTQWRQIDGGVNLTEVVDLEALEFEASPEPITNEIVRAIASLPRKYSEPLIMQIVEGKTLGAIALALEVSEEEVELRLAEGQGKLRKHLQIEPDAVFA